MADETLRPPEAASFHERPFPARPARIAAGSSEIALLDGDGRIVAVNQAWRKALVARGSAERDWGIGASYVEVICGLAPDLDRTALELGLLRLAAGGVEEVRHTYAPVAARGPGLRRLQITPLSVGAEGRFVAVHDDLTDLVQTREALQATTDELLAARDEERQRIAVELHDSTSQHLVSAGFGLARLRRAALFEGLETKIIDAIEMSLNEALKETRILSYLVEPRDLGPDGLSAGIRQFVAGFARRTGLEVRLDADPAIDGVSPALRHAALRIVQEALLNAHRHADAGSVSIALDLDPERLTVSVIDDGRGMGSERGEPCLGVGIPGMRARARQFSGHLEISSDGTGTRIVATLPLA
ncbi:sensor histidine kinase [Caulobacter sp.]|uniref:sensor histidine kinase n=1 Tax=Caulobacter sp. TaxID=78 RepID=UPI003BAFE6A5